MIKGKRICPHCSKEIDDRIYRRSLTSNMAAVLVQLLGRTKPWQWIHISKIPVRGGDYAKLRFWGLVEVAEDLPPGHAKKSPGLIRITDLGIDFARGHLRLPRIAVIESNTFRHLDGKDINIYEALRNKFNYAELMGAA